MLDSIRTHAQAWLAWVIIIPIILSFALWGVHEYFSPNPEVNVAIVGESKISQANFQQAYLDHRSRLQEMFGRNFDPTMFKEESMKQDVLDNLIEREALLQKASRSGFYVGQAQVGSSIRAIPEVQVEGKFDRALYLRLLEAQGNSPSAFEAIRRIELQADQMRRGIMDSAFVTAGEYETEVRLREQQRDIGYMILPAASFQKSDPASEEAIKTYYEANSARFAAPEMVSIEYIELSVNELAQDFDVTENEILQAYEQRATEFSTEEQRRASHILIQVAGDANADEQNKSKEQAEDLLARIRNGEAFASLARQYSQDPGSAQKGGDLGFFGKGIMDKEFEKAAFALKKGEVSELVRSSFGYHIIRLDDIMGGEVKPLDQVHAQIVNDIRRQKADLKFAEQGDTLATLAFEHPDSLEAAANALSLPIKTAEFFSKDKGTGISSRPLVRAAAFSDDVLREGHNSEPVEINSGHYVVLRVKEHKPARQPALDELREEIVIQLQKSAAQDRAREAGEAVVKRLNQGGDVNQIAGEFKLKWSHPGFAKRSDAAISKDIITSVFRMQHPEAGKVNFTGVALESGDYAIVGLYGVKDGEPVSAANADERRDAIKPAIGAQAEEEFMGYIETVKSEETIKLFPNNI